MSRHTKAGRRASFRAYCARVVWTREIDLWIASQRGRRLVRTLSGTVGAVARAIGSRRDEIAGLS